MGDLLRFFRFKSTAPVSKKLNPEQLPPMTAPELIAHLALDNRLREIRRLSSVIDHYWKTLYQQAIDNAAELMQLIPASGSHHHAGPGGLLTHTIEVCAHTMRIAKAYQLPLGVGPEQRSQLDQVWRYGLFCAALLHDMGKTLALVQITLSMKDGSTTSWSPYLGKMPDSTQSYWIQFQPADYHLHHQLSVSLMDILPGQARHWLLQDKKLIKQLMAWLNSDPYECGVIGEIVRQADRESTAADLKLGGHKVRFPGAFQLPMIDRLMTALRHLLNDGSLKLNRNGAAGWIYQGKAYLVCRTIANAVQKYLQDNGATDIPTDPTRLYDTWQEHGYALDNQNGGAIWKVAIEGEDYQLNLTVMVFEANRLFKVGHSPADMKGAIRVLSQDTNIKKLSQSSNSGTDTVESTGSDTASQQQEHLHQHKLSDPFDASNEQSTETTAYQSQHIDAASNNKQTVTITKPGELITPSEPLQQDSGSEPSSAPNNEKTRADTSDKNLAQIERQHILDPGAAPEINVAIPDPADPSIGEYFINWVKRSIRDKSLRVNRADTPVHIVSTGVVLVSPVILKKFCAKMGFDEMTGNKATWKIVQARFHKLKLHIKTENHVNIHKFQIQGSNRTSYMNGYLLPFEVIYSEGNHPELNKKIVHVG